MDEGYESAADAEVEAAIHECEDSDDEE